MITSFGELNQEWLTMSRPQHPIDECWVGPLVQNPNCFISDDADNAVSFLIKTCKNLPLWLLSLAGLMDETMYCDGGIF
jgi:hypothetical protein